MIYDLRFTIYALVFSLFSLTHAFGQGMLTPPGAPAPTMKSLDQVEARTPISSLPYTITSPGSYYLTTNLVATNSSLPGVEVVVDNVTIDLNGFALTHTTNSNTANGITSLAVRNLFVRNGTIQGWGNFGTDASESSGGAFERVCFCNNHGGGLGVGNNFLINNCLAISNDLGGITVSSGCIVVNNQCSATPNYYAFEVGGSGNRLEGNSAISNSVGFEIGGNGNLIVRNLAQGNSARGIECFSSSNTIIANNVSATSGGLNYNIAVNNCYGPLVTTTVSGVITNSNPWANFSF